MEKIFYIEDYLKGKLKLVTQLSHVLLLSYKDAKGHIFNNLRASELGFGKIAMIPNCFASTDAQRECYNTLKL